MKKIDFNINVNDNDIDDMNNKEAVHPTDTLTDDDYSNIEDHETLHKRINQENNLYTLIENELQLNPQLEDQNKTYDWKITNKLEGELVIAYNNNARSNKLYLRTFYALYSGPNNNGTGHLIIKLSTKRILTTMKYQPVPMPEDLIEVINEIDSLTTKIQINHFDSDRFTAQDDYFDNIQYDSQT